MKVTYILPIHKFDNVVELYLKRAFTSLNNMSIGGCELIIVGPKEVVEKTMTVYTDVGAIVPVTPVFSDKTDFCSMVNKAVYACTTSYFSVFEYDDAYTSNWFNDFVDYRKLEANASAYIPICQLTSDDIEKEELDELFKGFVNEVAWTSTFAESYGYVDKEMLEGYPDFNMTGAFIKTEDFIGVGGLKPSFGIVAWYEFLLRLRNNGKTIFVVPKCGYYHTIGRKGCYMEVVSQTEDVDKMAWLISMARKECEYNDERELVYTPENKGEA